MAAQLWASGPVNIYLMNNISQAIYFLGCGREGPSIREYQNWEDRKSDLGGTRVPDDRSYQRMFHITAVNMERWDSQVLQLFRDISAIAGFQSLGTPGVIDAQLTGALMIRQGISFGLIMTFPNQPLLAYNTGLPGYWFYYSQFEGPQEFTSGTRDNTDNLVFMSIGGLATIQNRLKWQHYTNAVNLLSLPPAIYT
jgi:hypothetical protein